MVLIIMALLTATRINAPVHVHSADPPAPTTNPSTRTRLATREARAAARSSLEEQLENESDGPDAIPLLVQLSEIDLLLNDFSASHTAAQEAILRARRSNERTALPDALLADARANRALGKNAVSEQELNEAIANSNQSNYLVGKAWGLVELISTLFALDRYAESITAGESALSACRELADRRCEARARYFLGAPYMALVRQHEAQQSLQNAVEIWHELAEPYDLAETLVELTFLAIRQGQWQRALGYLREASQAVEGQNAEPFLAGQIATSFGEVYEAYAQLELALTYFHEGLVLYRDQAHDQPGEIDTLRLAGRVEARLGQHQQAEQDIQTALSLSRSNQNRLMEALCIEELGRVYLARGDLLAAREQFEAAIPLYSGFGRQRELARAQAYLGQTLYALGEFAAAEIAYSRSLRTFRKIQDLTNEAAVNFGLGKLKLDQGELDPAGGYLKRSIELTEQLRENASSKDLRASFLASVHDRYETYVEWLMQQHTRNPGGGFDRAAFEASESGRARSLLDAIRGYQREMRGSADPSLLIEEDRLQVEERKLLDRRAEIRTGAAPATAEIETELAKVHAQLESLQAKMSGNVARARELLLVTPIKVDEVKTRIADPDTSLFEYSLGDHGSYLWVISADGLHTYTLPPKAQIETAARAVIEGMNHHPPSNASQPDLMTAIERLSQMLIGPAFDRLPRAKLIVVADGILQYVPFRALTGSGKIPLVADREVINAPSAAILAALREGQAGRPSHTKLVLAFGDPVIPPAIGSSDNAPTDPSRDASRFQELFYAGRELTEIRQLAADSVVYARYDATRERVLESDLSDYQVLHFATHGLFDANDPERSGLIMTMVDASGQRLDGFVGLADVYRLRAPADLVVLSACETALGKDVRGEGLVGLTRGFMYAGAPEVIASLWKVDDEASAELMKRFYANLLVEGMTPSAALTSAQNSMRKEPKWNAPYYWAAFTVQGDFGKPIKPPAHPQRTYYGLILVGSAAILMVIWLVCMVRRRTQRSKIPA
jgi:CHAT domain-containing protein/tetratricopeptide (TPR) repeat protein